jgi:predicted DNA-binding transcriptional regulator AlpA
MRNLSRDALVATDTDARQANALLRVEDLAKRIHKSVASIRSDVCRKPHALPPMCRLPGTKRLLWREEDVTQWLAEHVVVRTSLTRQTVKTTAPIRRRGRPTKADQVQRKTRER